MKRTLSLRREAIADLTTDDLATVAGAAQSGGASCPLTSCVDWSRLFGTCNCWTSTCS